jgi:hypothetical protein
MMNYRNKLDIGKFASVAAACGLALSANVHALPPSWWVQWGATDGSPLVDDAAANIGQLKHMASKAIAELEVNLPGGAGHVLLNMLADWRAPADPSGPVRDDSAALTVGQLKFLGKLFYDRLISVGYPTTYPWTTTDEDDDDTAMANVGQIKYVFRFDLQADADEDGIPDWQEPLLTSHTLDTDGDGMSNADEVAAGRDPFRRDNPAVQLTVEVIVR